MRRVSLALFAASLMIPCTHPHDLAAGEAITTPRWEHRGRISFPLGYSSATLPRDLHIRSLLAIDKRMKFGDYRWDDRIAATGATRILVNLRLQTISVFRDGHELGTAVILYGSDGTPTPSGTFRILERARYHRSNLYDAEMPYMLRLTMGGVAIHASSVREGFATHGCIGIPAAFAARLFAIARKGDIVTILPA